MTHEEIILEIIEAITVFGEEATDGECLDSVWGILTTNGYEELLNTRLSENAEKHMADKNWER
jgi:predicted house-cleaning noncanonical NTP pyrophosphatase (MazG superfamily)